MTLDIHQAVAKRSRELGGLDVARANIQANLEIIRKVPGITRLRNEWGGCHPAVVVAAGPSLDQAIPILQEKQPRIIACDRAVRPLLEAGIVPKFVVTVEGNATGAKKMQGLQGLERVPLLFHPGCYPETVTQYPGPLYTCEFPIEYKKKPNARPANPTAGKGRLPQGTGVIVYAVGLASYMGASPIVLVGADLSYPGERTHAAGVVEGLDVFDGEIEVPAVTGGVVKSDVFFAANIEELSTWFEGTLIQTSPAGARIPGWSHERLEDVL